MRESKYVELFIEAVSKRKYGHTAVDGIRLPYFEDYRPDLLIKAGRKNLAAIEFKRNLTISGALDLFEKDYFFKFQVRYLVYTDGEVYFLFDRFNLLKRPHEFDMDAVIKRITTRMSTERLQKIKLSAFETFLSVAEKHSNRLPGVYEMLNENRSLFFEAVKLSSTYKLYFDGNRDDNESFEYLLFQKLLNNEVSERIYRYCSFYRAFQVLNDNEIAMHGLPGMNDTTEPNYVDNYLNSAEDQVWEMTDTSRATINRRFIISFTTLKDELLPWRLYGDDGRGACIEFNPIASLIDNDRFSLGRVKYANEKGEHVELEYLKKIIQDLRKSTMVDFRFLLMFIWRHFFKPKAYEYEQEVRLLFVLRKKEREKKWLIAEPYGIVNPFVVFKLNEKDFPLELKQVILGPKKAESDLNVSQLQQMVLDKGLNCDVSKSNVKVYR